MKTSKDIRRMTLSNFYCTQCGNKGIPIFRKPGQGREPGHLKKLYCLTCKQETNMAEIRPYGDYNLEDFWIEYNYGNFDQEGNRIEPSWKKFVFNTKQKEGLN